MNAKQIFIKIFLLSFLGFLQSCASSNVSRDAASNIDVGYHNTIAQGENAGNGSVADSYQNSKQVTKGILYGGIAGGVAGALTNGIGLVPGIAMGAIFGGAYGAYIDSNTTSSDRLENRG